MRSGSWREFFARSAAPAEILDPLYRFARELKSVDEAPAAMRAALTAALPPQAAIRSLIFSPGFQSISAEAATLFAVLDRHWVVVSGMAEGEARVDRAAFADTLSAELTTVLLSGRLKLDYAAADGAHAAVIEFNTVMDRIYRRALRLVLDGVEGMAGSPAIADPRLDGLVKHAPIKFRCAARDCRPPAQSVVAARHWPAAMARGRGRMRREHAPQAMLLLTERELICVAEERTPWWLQFVRRARYGYVATFCPLSRLTGWRIAAGADVATLELELSAPGGGATVTAGLPREEQRAVAAMLGERLAA